MKNAIKIHLQPSTPIHTVEVNLHDVLAFAGLTKSEWNALPRFEKYPILARFTAAMQMPSWNVTAFD